MKKSCGLFLTIVGLFSLFTVGCTQTKSSSNPTPTPHHDDKKPYETTSWDNKLKEMLDKYTTNASAVVPAIPAERYVVSYATSNGVNATVVQGYGVDYYGVDNAYVSSLESKGFLIYNGSTTEGTPYRYAYKLATAVNDLYVDFALGTINNQAIYQIYVYELTNRTTTFPSSDYEYLFGEVIPVPEAESFEAYYDETYMSYILYAHNTGASGLDAYYTKVLGTGKYTLNSTYSASEQYYFVSLDGYTNIVVYETYDEYNRLSLQISTSTNSFRIETLNYLGFALPNFTEEIDEKMSFTHSSVIEDTFLIYYGPTTDSFYGEYCQKLIDEGWRNSSTHQGESYTSKTFERTYKNSLGMNVTVSFDCMFGLMQDSGEWTIVIVISTKQEVIQMKKTTLLLSGLLLSTLCITGCTKKSNGKTTPTPSGDPDDPGGGGQIIRHDDWDNLLTYDYSNMTVADTDSYLEDPSYVYYISEGKYINHYAVLGEWQHQFFADYEGKNYVYWDYRNSGGTDGWINYNEKYHVDLSLGHQDFYMPNLVANISKDDVEYSALTNAFYVKSSELARISRSVFGFAIDHPTFKSIVIAQSRDENNKDYINKIYCFDNDSDNSPYVLLEFGYYGQTASQWDFPAVPTAETIKDYWTITGTPYEPEVYPESVSIAANSVNDTDPVTHDSDFDIIVEVGDYVDLSYEVGPDNVNCSYIIDWEPDRSSYVDADGNPTDEYADQVALVDVKQNWTAKHKYLTAMKPGTVNVVAKAEFFKYDENEQATYTEVTSNILKVKVNEPKEQDVTNAVYQFNFTAYEDEYNDQAWGSASGIFQTRFSYTNLAETSTFHPESVMTGYHAKLLEGDYTDAFEGSNYVLWMTPYVGNPNEGLSAYTIFDLKDQDVKSLSFYYSLHRSGQLTNGFQNYKSFKIYSSADGLNWDLAVDASEEIKTELLKDEGNAMGMQAHLFEFEFTSATRFIKFEAEAKSATGNFGLVFDKIVFVNEEHTHVETAHVDVTGVDIVLDSENTTTVRKGNSITLGYQMNPSNASNNIVYWTSSDHTVATVTRNIDGTVSINGLKVGETKITVYTNEKDSQGNSYKDEVVITVLGDATIPSDIDGHTYTKIDGSDVLAFTFDAEKGSMTATYLLSGALYSDTLLLTNEVSGLYTFTSEDSMVMIRVNDSGASISIVNKTGQTSNIKGQNLSVMEINRSN